VYLTRDALQPAPPDVLWLAQRLCAPGLHAAEIEVEKMSLAFEIDGADAPGVRLKARDVVRAMAAQAYGQFALEVAVNPFQDDYLGRLAWRRWPPPCSPEWQAAAGAHAQALAWAEEHAPRFIF